MKGVIKSKILLTVLLLIKIYFVSLPAYAKYGIGTDTYVFLADQSNVIKTGGIAGVHETYPIQGLFKLKVDANAAVASFVYVDAFLLSPVSSSPPQNLGELFNMTELEGIVVDDLLLDFRGKTADDTNTDISLKLTFTDDAVRLTGLTIPPPGSADFFIFNLEAIAQKKYSGGTGDPNNPYRIATAEDLMLLGESTEDYDKHFVMIDDIDFDPNLPGRKVFDRAIIGSSGFFPFTGVFDGNGHVISNLNIQRSGLERFILPINHGLFGQLQSEAEVRNLGVNDVNINISVSSDDDYKVGGIAGVNFGNVIQCHSTGSVSGGEFVGGLVGHNGGNVAVCYSTCAVTGIRMIPYWIVWPGWPGERLVEAGEGGVGGLVGYNTGSIDMSYSTGAVSGNDCVGGLVGANGSYPIPKPMKPILVPIDSNLPLGPIFPFDPNFFIDPNFPVDPNFFVLPPFGWIKNCYATGSVTGGKRFGGLVGENKFGEVVTSFWDIETSGQTYSDSGIGKTTYEMQTASTFLEAGWDFVGETENGIEDIWWIDEGQGYPRLWWEDSFFLVVDDFESYNDLNEEEPESKLIWNTWIDGFDNPEINGSVVGGDYWTATIVHSGNQSMPFYYNNAVGKSEATFTLTSNHDWTIKGLNTLTIWFRGNANNPAETMYVVLNGSAAVNHDNPNATQVDIWMEWRISLREFYIQGVNLANVNSITLGFGNRDNPQPGGSGLVYFDDIRLYRSSP